MRFRRDILSLKTWGYARSGTFYIEGTPGQAHFILRVRQVWHNLHWGYARSGTFYIEGTLGKSDPWSQNCCEYWGYARSGIIYTEGTPGQAHFILRVRQVWHNLYWGYARFDTIYTEGTPGQAHFILRVRQVNNSKLNPTKLVIHLFFLFLWLLFCFEREKNISTIIPLIFWDRSNMYKNFVAIAQTRETLIHRTRCHAFLQPT